MCSQYTQKFNDIEQFCIDKDFDLPKEVSRYSEYVFPHKPAVVIEKGKKTVMSYSLVPSWSKERKPKFATYNARIESIIEKPTWKTSFVSNHCIVPMSSFIEPIYAGEFGGYMVGFSSDDPMYAAGISNLWIDKETGEKIPTFAMIMKEPYKFVEQIGHDRSPVLLSAAASKEWLASEGEDPELLRDFLLDNVMPYEKFKVAKLRALKSRPSS